MPASNDRHIEFRNEVLSMIDPLLQPLPSQPSVAFVWSTELCSIGCAHCSYSSPKKGTEEQRLLAKFPKEIVNWLLDAGVKRFVVCGGGEPLDEPDFLLESITECAKAGLDFEIYTSGVSFSKPNSIEQYIKNWINCWKGKSRPTQRFNVRLSLDVFHEELIGLQPLVEWIYLLNQYAPDWNVSIRSVRVEGDESVNRFAQLLNGSLEKKNNSSGFILLPSGQKIIVQWKGFVLEGRGQLKQLQRLNLKLPQQDMEIINPFLNKWNKKNELGRPLSLHHAVSFHRIDLEVHANCDVHILQSQANDIRLKFLTHSWRQIKETYYRDPLLHCTVENGLSAIAKLISECQAAGVAAKDSIPFSIEKIIDSKTLAWVTAKAVLTNSKQFQYSDDTIILAKEYLTQHQ